MANHSGETSPLVYARVAGLMYLIMAICGPFSLLYVPSKLVVSGDATATANNIMASEWLFRLGFVGESIVFLSEIVLVVMLYTLFKPVSKTLSLVAAFFRLAMATIQGINLLNKFTALLLLSGAAYLTIFKPDQLHALALLYLNAHEYGAFIWGAFFGFHCLVLGYLLYKSTYLPRILGILLAAASVGYLTDSFGNFLFANYEATISLVFLVPGTIGELLLAFWLLFKGVDVQKWHDRNKDTVVS
ncbi:DUF4386 domain-containing protein [candidate division KSB1 bacterium]